MNLFHRLFLMAQDLYIKLNSLVSPSVIHNTEKHKTLKKMLFYKQIEGIEGDYLEFGVYEGTSLKGAATYWRRIGSKPIRFYGFDSFKGMLPEKGDEHPFYLTFDFSTDFRVVKDRFSALPEVRLIPGFFQQTLSKSPLEYGIKKAAVIMVDCDLPSSSQMVFRFIKPIIQEGTLFILDDYLGYKGDSLKGVRGAFDKFVKDNGLQVSKMCDYGIGGAVFIVSKIKK